MKDYVPRSVFIDKTVEALETDFSVRSVEPNDLLSLLNTNFCPSTRLLTRKELDAAAFASQTESSNEFLNSRVG